MLFTRTVCQLTEAMCIDEVVDGPCSVIYDVAENMLHVEKAILAMIMSKGHNKRIVTHEKRPPARALCEVSNLNRHQNLLMYNKRLPYFDLCNDWFLRN